MMHFLKILLVMLLEFEDWTTTACKIFGKLSRWSALKAILDAGLEDFMLVLLLELRHRSRR